MMAKIPNFISNKNQINQITFCKSNQQKFQSVLSTSKILTPFSVITSGKGTTVKYHINHNKLLIENEANKLICKMFLVQCNALWKYNTQSIPNNTSRQLQLVIPSRRISPISHSTNRPYHNLIKYHISNMSKFSFFIRLLS